MMGVPRDHKTPYTKKGECHECGEKFKKSETIKSGKVVELHVYDDPWADEPCTVRVHALNDDERNGSCLDKLTDTGWADFRYQDCPACGRLVMSQCLDNGWRGYFKTDGDEDICVRCYQERRLADGEPLESFDDGHIPGDFYDSSELANYNWALVPGLQGVHISGSKGAAEFCARAIAFIKDGQKVLVDYERMGIGGGEGYVSLYLKGGVENAG
jgi:hypothetical protein